MPDHLVLLKEHASDLNHKVATSVEQGLVSDSLEDLKHLILDELFAFLGDSLPEVGVVFLVVNILRVEGGGAHITSQNHSCKLLNISLLVLVLDDEGEVAGIFVWFLQLNLFELLFALLSDFILGLEDLVESRDDVVLFFFVH